MKITKLVHACLLVETEDNVTLFDPGIWSFESGLLDIATMPRLDNIVITHEHADHFHLPFVQKLVDKFPKLRIISTDPVVEQLKAAGIQNASSEDTESIKIFSRKPHADLSPLGQPPENIAVHYKGQLTVGGDRHDLEESKDILALTMTAPWGSMVVATSMALRLKPKYILPVHDWHLNDAARLEAHDRLEEFFGEQEIKFIKLINGQAVEL